MKNEIKFEAGSSREQIKADSKAARFLRWLENDLPSQVAVTVKVEPLCVGSPDLLVYVTVRPAHPFGDRKLSDWAGLAHFLIKPGRKTSFRTYRASERVRCSRSSFLGSRYANCTLTALYQWLGYETDAEARRQAINVR